MKYLTGAQMAKRLKVSRGTLYNWRRSGRINFVKKGNRILYPEDPKKLKRYDFDPLIYREIFTFYLENFKYKKVRFVKAVAKIQFGLRDRWMKPKYGSGEIIIYLKYLSKKYKRFRIFKKKGIRYCEYVFKNVKRTRWNKIENLAVLVDRGEEPGNPSVPSPDYMYKIYDGRNKISLKTYLSDNIECTTERQLLQHLKNLVTGGTGIELEWDPEGYIKWIWLTDMPEEFEEYEEMFEGTSEDWKEKMGLDDLPEGPGESMEDIAIRLLGDQGNNWSGELRKVEKKKSKKRKGKKR